MFVFVEYKFNDYLISTYDDNDNLIIYDTLRKNIWMIDKERIDRVKEIVSQIEQTGKYNGSKQLLDTLLKCNIIQPADTNVTDELEALYHNVFFNQNTLSLILLPTEECNFRCIYCYEDFKNSKMNKDIVLKIEETIKSLLPKYNVLNLSWFGGEPLLAMDVIKRISETALGVCKKLRKPFYSSITTNGYLLDLQTMKTLLKLHVLYFQVTLDGNKLSHDKQRVLKNGDGTYDTILKNLIDIKNKIKTKTIKIRIRVNLSKNVGENALAEISKLFGDDERFVITPRRVFEVGKDSDSKTIDLYKYIDSIDKCSTRYIDDLDPHETICYAAKENTLMIRSNGSIGKCTVNFQDKDNYFGNILEQDIENFALSSCSYNRSEHKKEECIKCSIYPICFGRQCPARKRQLCDILIKKYTKEIKLLSAEAKIVEII